MDELIKILLGKYIMQMTGDELCQLLEYTFNKYAGGKEVATHRIYGAANLAEYLGCSEAQIRKLKRQGVFDPAIIPSVGKTTVFLAEEAQRCIDNYKAAKEA